MKAQRSHPDSGGASLRPRVVDVSGDTYAAVEAVVEAGDTAYFERKGGETTLVIR